MKYVMRVDMPAPALRVNEHGRLAPVEPVVRYDESTGRMLPPSDAPGGVFCATCAAVPADERCDGCPRGGRRSFAAFAVAPTDETEPRRRWPWRKRAPK